jgi:hypothetical protein
MEEPGPERGLPSTRRPSRPCRDFNHGRDLAKTGPGPNPSRRASRPALMSPSRRASLGPGSEPWRGGGRPARSAKRRRIAGARVRAACRRGCRPPPRGPVAARSRPRGLLRGGGRHESRRAGGGRRTAVQSLHRRAASPHRRRGGGREGGRARSRPAGSRPGLPLTRCTPIRPPPSAPRPHRSPIVGGRPPRSAQRLARPGRAPTERGRLARCWKARVSIPMPLARKNTAIGASHVQLHR